MLIRPLREKMMKASDADLKLNLRAAKAALEANNPKGGYSHLGDAIHTATDATSPSHRGFQDWNTQDHKEHVVAERKYPGQGTREQIELEGSVRWMYDIGKGDAPMPDRFFNPETGLLELPAKYKREEQQPTESAPADAGPAVVLPPLGT